jgi:outer membrane murein-binding lipoprotein Lpp
MIETSATPFQAPDIQTKTDRKNRMANNRECDALACRASNLNDEMDRLNKVMDQLSDELKGCNSNTCRERVQSDVKDTTKKGFDLLERYETILKHAKDSGCRPGLRCSTKKNVAGRGALAEAKMWLAFAKQVREMNMNLEGGGRRRRQTKKARKVSRKRK